jgi:peptidase S46-like protein
MNARLPLLALIAVSFAAERSARADEGMWLFNQFPKDLVKARYGFAPTDEWLEHVRLASVRIAGGCSASLVSSQGLILTNHHCAHSCIEQLSTKDRDYIKTGFYAKTQADEVKCPEIEINQLVEITDVTARINNATKGLADQKYNEAQKSEMSKIEKECATSDSLRCDVVTLHHGGAYHLYKYKRFQDVRLVFAPELPIAFFGGDPDNFNFPRYDLDMSMIRIYENGAPANVDHYLRWSTQSAKENDLSFVSGNPGGTDRGLTVAELEYQRDVAMPWILLRLAEWRGVLTEFQKKSEEAKRISTKDLFYVENSYKALKGEHGALLEKALMDKKRADEAELRAKIEASPEMKKKYGGAFEAIAKAQHELRNIRLQYNMLERSFGFSCQLCGIARTLVRAAEERPKPNEKRFREYRDSALPQVTQQLFSEAPIYDELELTKLTFALTKLREELGADDGFVKKVLGKESPEELAARLIKSTKLKAVDQRKKLWEGGKKAIDASDDPLIKIVKLMDPDARAVRKKYEDEIEAPVKKNSEALAKARFEASGTSNYPDATFTLRLSFGTIKGWNELGKYVKPITTFGGAFERATGRAPFDLPESWIAAKKSLDSNTPFNMATTNDIIGGNSGSPVVNKDAQLIGLIFDGNIHSLGGNYGFDDSNNRAVAVHSQGIISALEKIYHADRLVQEIKSKAQVGTR